MRDKAKSFLERGTFSTRKTIAEGEFGGSHLLDRAFFDWSGKPWYVPLNPPFFLATFVGLIALVFYGLYDITSRVNSFDNSAQRTLTSLGAIAASLGASIFAQLLFYLVAHILGAKALVLTCFLVHTLMIAMLFWKSLWAGGILCTFTFIITWPWLWVKFQNMDVANAHLRVWKEMLNKGDASEAGGKCPCTGGYGYNVLSNIIVVNIAGFIFICIWATVFMGYCITSHTTMNYDDEIEQGIHQGILFGMFIFGFWMCGTLNNVIYSLMGYVCVVWSKSSEEYSICTSTTVRVWWTNFGANSYAAFVIPILEPLHVFSYFFFAPCANKERTKPDGCLGRCCYNFGQVIKTYAMGIQEMTVYYNMKGLLMTVCFGVPFVTGSELTAHIPKEENPIMPYLALLTSVAGGSLACFTAAYWADQDFEIWAWRDYLAFVALLGGHFMSGITMTGIRGASDATDFLRHDGGGKTYNRGRDTFCAK